MSILLWLRALRHLNFYNWNARYEGHMELICIDLKDLKFLELGMLIRVTYVNRQTGKITFKHT